MTDKINSPFSFSTTFVLDKAYFNECYQQTVIQDQSWRAYRKALIMMFIGLILLMFIDGANYPASFIVGLGILEALSTKYQKAWWVTRQSLSRAADNDTNLVINEEGITIHSAYVNNEWSWADLDDITETSQGWILVHHKARYYLSNRCLSPEAICFIKVKAESAAQKESNI